MSASRAHKLVYDSDDYEWEEYNKGWKNGVGAVEVAAASGVVVEGKPGACFLIAMGALKL